LADEQEATPRGGLSHGASASLTAWGRPLVLLDSIAAAGPESAGAVAVSGSHGGASAARYAIAARPYLTCFNDAGVGKDQAGIVGLAMLQAEGLAALTVAHTSACIGQASSTLADGVISHVNTAAAAIGARPGLRLKEWLGLP
jgi:hypothetical protein